MCVSIALGIQHAKHMHHTILLSVVCPAVSCFPHYIIEGRMRVWNFSIILSEIILVLKRTD